MNPVEQLERQIAELDEAELKVRRAWFERYDAEIWDLQIESDARSGRLTRQTERAVSDRAAGRSTEL